MVHEIIMIRLFLKRFGEVERNLPMLNLIISLLNSKYDFFFMSQMLSLDVILLLLCVCVFNMINDNRMDCTALKRLGH